MKPIFVVLCGLCCVTTACTTIDSPADMLARYKADDLKAVAFAEKVESPAKGTRTCSVEQLTSAYKTRNNITEPGGYVGPTKLAVKVWRDGNAGITVVKQTYPSTRQYFLIGGRRFAGDGDHYVMLDRAALRAVADGGVIKFTWYDWPYKAEHNDEDALAGFQAAYDECLAFLRGERPA